jgi:hypothetical protein
VKLVEFSGKKDEISERNDYELEINRTENIIGLYGDINEFKKDYERRTNLVKDENGDLLAVSRSIFNIWKNYSLSY